MLLTCDIGNSQINFGCFRNKKLIHYFDIKTDKNEKAAHFAGNLKPKLGRCKINKITIASVVPSVTSEVAIAVEQITKIRPQVLRNEDIPVVNKYEKPELVGTDRLLNAYGAIQLFETPIIIIDFGTATTFDVISSEGEYLGGSIVPGVETSLEALFGNASQLDAVELKKPTSTIGQSTEESIRSGVVIGTAGLVDKIVTEIEKDLGNSTKVATGGLAALIIPYSEKVTKTEPHLTLKAMAMLSEA